MSKQGGAGQGHPLGSPTSPACSPPSRYPDLQAGRSQLYPIFISHIVATGKWIPSPRQASQLPLPPSTAWHSTPSALRDGRVEAPKGGRILCGVGRPLPCPSEPWTPLPSALPLLPMTSRLPATCSVPCTAKTLPSGAHPRLWEGQGTEARDHVSRPLSGSPAHPSLGLLICQGDQVTYVIGKDCFIKHSIFSAQHPVRPTQGMLNRNMLHQYVGEGRKEGPTGPRGWP